MKNYILVCCGIAFLLIILIPSRVCSQANFIPGKIITKTNDTLKGLIDYRNWDNNPKKVAFKETENAPKTEFNPLAIKGFMAANEIYFSAIVDAEASVFDLSRIDPKVVYLSESPEVIKRKDTVFLRALYLGSKSLYMYKDIDAKLHFYINKGQDFDLLIYKKYVKWSEGPSWQKQIDPVRTIAENKTYVGQLKLYMADCQGLETLLNATLYRESSLLNLFRNYYKKLDIRPDYQHAAESTKFDFGIIAGISSSSVNYQSDVSSYYFLTKSDHSPSVNFCAGISLDARMPRRLSRLSIHNELLINSMEFDGRYEQFSSLSYDTINFKLGYIYLRLINMLRYSFTFRNDWSVFVNAGISNAFVLMNKNEKIQSNIFHNATESKAIESDINMEIFNLVGGAGVRYKNVSLDITYERTIGMPSITDLGINTNRLYVMMGYHF